MTLLETLALLTSLATVSFGVFDVAWKIFNNKKMTAVPTKLVRSFFVIDLPERY